MRSEVSWISELQLLWRSRVKTFWLFPTFTSTKWPNLSFFMEFNDEFVRVKVNFLKGGWRPDMREAARRDRELSAISTSVDRAGSREGTLICSYFCSVTSVWKKDENHSLEEIYLLLTALLSQRRRWRWTAPVSFHASKNQAKWAERVRDDRPKHCKSGRWRYLDNLRTMRCESSQLRLLKIRPALSVDLRRRRTLWCPLIPQTNDRKKSICVSVRQHRMHL